MDCASSQIEAYFCANRWLNNGVFAIVESIKQAVVVKIFQVGPVEWVIPIRQCPAMVAKVFTILIGVSAFIKVIVTVCTPIAMANARNQFLPSSDMPQLKLRQRVADSRYYHVQQHPCDWQ